MTILETTLTIICCLLAVIAVAQGIIAGRAITIDKDNQLLHDANESYMQSRKEFVDEIDRLRREVTNLANERNYWKMKAERVQRPRAKKSND